MRVHLIAPCREEALRSRTKASVAPPLGLAILASVTPGDVEVSLTDENLTPLDFQRPADLVGITASTHTATRAYQLADYFRAQGMKVVLGGMHPTALPAEAGQHADAVVVGEAEDVWGQVLADVQDGRIQPFYRGQKRLHLAGLPGPRRDLFQREGYLFPDTIYTTRGCPYGCTFCAVTSFFGGTYRSRPVAEVLAEVEGLRDRRLVFFVDDNIAAHRGRAKQLFRALAPYKLAWIGQAPVSIAKDEDLLAQAAASGCLALFIGFESVSPASLSAVGKKSNVVEEYEEAIRRIHARGIAIFGGFIFGLDHDTEDVFEKTVRFAQRARLEGAQFNVLTPYPGTPLSADLEREGRILTRDWAQYRGDRVVFAPRLISARRLQEGHDWAWREFYSLGSIWGRVGLSHPRRLLMWALNLNYRDDPLSRVLFESLVGRVGRFL